MAMSIQVPLRPGRVGERAGWTCHFLAAKVSKKFPTLVFFIASADSGPPSPYSTCRVTHHSAYWAETPVWSCLGACKNPEGTLLTASGGDGRSDVGCPEWVQDKGLCNGCCISFSPHSISPYLTNKYEYEKKQLPEDRAVFASCLE